MGIIPKLFHFRLHSYQFAALKSIAVLWKDYRPPLANELKLVFDFVESLTLKHSVARSVGLLGQALGPSAFAQPFGILLSLLQYVFVDWESLKYCLRYSHS